MNDFFIAFLNACLVSAFNPQMPLRCDLVEDEQKYETLEQCQEQQEKLVNAMAKHIQRGIPVERVIQFKLSMPYNFTCVQESKKEKFLEEISPKDKKPGTDT